MLGIAALLTIVILPFHLACILALVLAMLAVVIGSLALILIQRTTGAFIGRGVAWAGIILACFIYLVLAPSSLVPKTKNDWHNLKERIWYPEHETMGRGKSIYIVLYFGGEDAARAPEFEYCPKFDTFRNSSVFFISMIKNRLLINIDYSFFSAPGVTPYCGTNSALFKAENNAWCFVSDFNFTESDRMPILFTRNLKVSNLADLKGRVGDQLSKEAPFGRKLVVIVFKDGKVFALKPDMLWSNVFGGQTFTNRVLRP